jgi:magnesium chelatase family protein
LHPLTPKTAPARKNTSGLANLKGADTVRHVLETAALGGHHLLMVGLSGAGKSLPDLQFAGFLPLLSPAKVLEVTMLHSLADNLTEGGFI